MSREIETAYKLYNYQQYRVKVLGKPEHGLLKKYKQMLTKLSKENK